MKLQGLVIADEGETINQRSKVLTFSMKFDPDYQTVH
jgi:hypothetical protein